MNTAEIKKDHSNTAPFPIVGIGTAASEIKILKKILSDLPTDSGMAYIIIENLATEQNKNLSELLIEHTKLPVQEIINTVELHPDNIYVIPHNNFLVFENEILQLKPCTRSSNTTNCFDLFFDALSQKYGTHAVGLLLFWSQLDGTFGLKRLKEFGGAAVSAINTSSFLLNEKTSEFIDYFTTPEQTTSKLLEIKNSYVANHAYEEDDISVFDENIFESIVEVIFIKTGTNFHNYKEQTLRRRIAKRMVVTKQENAEKYLNLLRNNPREQDLLFNDFLISVTYFFRDQQFFDNLPQNVFPSLIETLTGKELRIWSAGCSTGEEVYSLAICVHEYLQKTKNTDITVKIFASDLSEKCIEKARAGIYQLQDLKNINAKRVSEYFTKRNSGYYINKIIRDMCVFAVHDLTKDFPFSKIDLISCRNVLIYFNAELQNQVLTSFHYALRDKGFLILGRSETAHKLQNLYLAVEKQDKIYIRKTTDIRYANNFLPNNTIQNNSADSPSPIEKDFRKISNDILLEHYSPASVLITEDFEIVHFHGNTSPFLQPPAGKPSFNIINMAHQELRFALSNAILKSRNEKKNIQSENISVKNQSFLTSFEAVYLPNHPELLLILFSKKTIYEGNKIFDRNSENDIEKELSMLHDDFRLLSEEQQVYFEELRTSNEELLRRTEELQYLNEQLETSAEELLSNNEELSCTNDELRNRRNELYSMRNYYESIVKTIKEPLIIINKNFIVHSANPAFYSYFKTHEEQTEGFSIFELGNSQWNAPEIKESFLNKIRRNEPVENVKINFDLGAGRKKIMLANATQIVGSIPEGMILIALEDITDLEQSNETLREMNAELENHTRELESFTLAASHKLLEPISKIYMFGKKIIDSESGLSEAGSHNLKRLLVSASNMNRLIEDIINYSKINFSEKKFKKTDLNIVVKKAINDLKNVIKEHNAVITADILPTIKIIPWQIHLLFTHLISNAVKYARQDRDPHIRISMELTDMEEFNNFDADPYTDYIKLAISDNGRGFNKDFEALIFTPFYKLENDDKQYGTGLGLTLAQKIVWNHKGFIKASSSPGEGTTIYIYLAVETSLIENYSPN